MVFFGCCCFCCCYVSPACVSEIHAPVYGLESCSGHRTMASSSSVFFSFSFIISIFGERWLLDSLRFRSSALFFSYRCSPRFPLSVVLYIFFFFRFHKKYQIKSKNNNKKWFDFVSFLLKIGTNRPLELRTPLRSRSSVNENAATRPLIAPQLTDISFFFL